jgi:hypothetical protein
MEESPVAGSPKRRRPAQRRPPDQRSRASEDLTLFCTLFAAWTGAVHSLNYSNSVRLGLLVIGVFLAFLLVQRVRNRSLVETIRAATPRARLLFLIVLLAIVTTFVGLRPAASYLGISLDPSRPADGSTASRAYVRYHVTKAVTLRAGPGPLFAPVEDVGVGTPVDVVCQAHGAAFEGSRIWNRLTGGQWVPDALTNSPNHGRDVLSPPGRWC